jgi:hypothetical protein
VSSFVNDGSAHHKTILPKIGKKITKTNVLPFCHKKCTFNFFQFDQIFASLVVPALHGGEALISFKPFDNLGTTSLVNCVLISKTARHHIFILRL